MLRTISTLMALGAITTACSGGSGDVAVDTADRTAPVVTLTASSTSVQGGETIALTARATDNVDGSVEARLTCTGGTLVGDLLVTTTATAASSISCTATATDKAGNAGTAAATIQVAPTVSTLSLAEPSQTLQAGEIAIFLATNLALDQASYAGKIAGKDVTFHRSADGKSLNFLTPESLPTGDQRATVAVGARTYSFAVKIDATPTIGDARAIVLDYLTQRKTLLQQALLSPTAGVLAPKRAQAAQYVTQMQSAIDGIDTASAADLRAIALMIVSNPIDLSAAAAGIKGLAQAGKGDQGNLSACLIATKNFAFSTVVLAAIVNLTTDMLPAAGTGLGLGIIAGGIAVGYLVYKMGVVESLAQTLDYCLVRTVKLVFTAVVDAKQIKGTQYVKALAAEPVYSFRNNQPTRFNLVQEESLFAEGVSMIGGTFGRLYDAVVQFVEPPATMARARTLIQGPVTGPAQAAGIALSGISRGDIQGSAQGSGSTVSLTFRAIDPKDENIDFSFVLTPAGADPIPVSAQLTLALPHVDDASITVRQATPSSSTVQFRGADTLEVVTQPAHGSVTLRADGSFSYTPSGQYFGEDRFTYRGRNANGVSQPATVLINVRREFEGAWAITTRATTTSQSQPGLCPNEVNSFSVQIAKVSDTQYTTSYQGVPLTFTMSSANDPNGLTATWSGTYDDDPGKTTETVNVQIPNSSQITGSTSWSYAGPGNTSCSGSTSITGSRP